MTEFTEEEKYELYRSALNEWGNVMQRVVTMEECAELIKAISHSFRWDDMGDSIVEEVADVEIMCEQMRQVYGSERVERMKQAKLARLAGRLGMESAFIKDGE